MKQLVLLLLVFAVFFLAYCVFYYANKARLDEYVKKSRIFSICYSSFL